MININMEEGRKRKEGMGAAKKNNKIMDMYNSEGRDGETNCMTKYELASPHFLWPGCCLWD